MRDYTIMIVDDEPDILDLLEKALAREGYSKIIKAQDGVCAVKICRKSPPG